MRFTRWWMVAVMVLAACGSSHDSDTLAAPAATVEARQGETFRLRPGESARLVGTGVIVGFRAIVEDSRCPGDVVCVWQGNASARFTATLAAGTAVTFDLNTTLDPKATEVGGRTITLVAVEPYPVSTGPIDPARYVVTLRVD